MAYQSPSPVLAALPPGRGPGQKGAMTPAIASALMPLMRGMDAETAHGIALRALSLGLAGQDRGADRASLATEVAGLRFRNPLGLAAGFRVLR